MTIYQTRSHRSTSTPMSSSVSSTKTVINSCASKAGRKASPRPNGRWANCCATTTTKCGILEGTPPPLPHRGQHLRPRHAGQLARHLGQYRRGAGAALRARLPDRWRSAKSLPTPSTRRPISAGRIELFGADLQDVPCGTSRESAAISVTCPAIPSTCACSGALPSYMYTDYTAFVHASARRADGRQHDQQPLSGFIPTSYWPPRQVIADDYALALLAGAPPGNYQIIVGLYDLATMNRLPLSRGWAKDSVVAATFSVQVPWAPAGAPVRHVRSAKKPPSTLLLALILWLPRLGARPACIRRRACSWLTAPGNFYLALAAATQSPPSSAIIPASPPCGWAWPTTCGATPATRQPPPPRSTT